MTTSTDCDALIQRLVEFLTQEQKAPLEFNEIAFLMRMHIPGMSLFEFVALLAEFRFEAFFRKLLNACPDAPIDELRILAREYYLKGESVSAARQAYSSRTLLQQRQVNDTAMQAKNDPT